MPGGSEVGIAYVTLAASAKGLLGDIQREMNVVGPAGDKAGASFMDGFKKAAVLGAAAAAAAIAGVTAKGIKDFIVFEGQMNEVFTLLPDISEKSMGAMQQDAKDLAREMGVLPEKVVPALYQAISAGVPQDNVFAFLETAQKAAVGGVTDLETAVDGISSVVNAYGSDVLSAGEASDLMFSAVKLGKTNFEQLSASIFNVTPIASSLGVEFGDVTAALAAMTAQGVPTSVATTQLRSLMVELSQTGGDVDSLFKELAGKSFKDFVSEGGNTSEALALLEGGAKDLGLDIKELFGSVEAGSAAMALTGKGAERFNAALLEMGNSAGATDKAFGTMEKGIGHKIEKLKANWKVFLLTIGEAAAPLVGFVADKLLPLMTTMFGAIGSLLEPIKEKIGALGLSFGDLGGALGMLNPIMAIFKEFWPLLVPLFKQVVDIVLELAAQVLPILTQAWQMVLDIVGPVLEAILGVVMDVFPTIMSIIQTVMDALLPLIKGVLDIIKGIWDEHGTEIMRIVTTVFAAIGPVIEAALKIIQGIIQVVTGLISGDWDEVWTGIKTFFSGIWDAIKSILNLAWEAIKGIFKAALEVIKGVWDAAWGAVKLVFTNIWNGIKSVAQSIWDSFKGAFSAMWDAMKGIWDTAASWIGAIPGKIKAFFTGAIDWLKKFGEDIINGLWNGLKAIWEKVSGWFGGLGGRIKNFFSDAGSWLRDIGKAIIQGLWDGMKDIWGGLTGWVGDLGGWIADLKGPLDKDKVLLYEQGNVIIGGLARGMKSALPQVEDLLTDLTGSIGGEFAVSGPMGAGDGGHRVNNINIVVHINGQGAAAGEQAVNVITRRLATLGV